MHDHSCGAGIGDLEESRTLVGIQRSVLHPLCGCPRPGVLPLAVFVVELTLIVTLHLSASQYHSRRSRNRFVEHFLLLRRWGEWLSFNNPDA